VYVAHNKMSKYGSAQFIKYMEHHLQSHGKKAKFAIYTLVQITVPLTGLSGIPYKELL